MITVITQPATYSPTNAAIFKVSSDLLGILQFRVVVTDTNTGLVMTTQKYSNLPMFPTGAVFDLAPVLTSFIDYDIQPGGSMLLPVPKILKRYSVEVIELYRNTDGVITEGDSLLIPDDFYIYNADLDAVTFNYYNPEYYIAGGVLPTMFLNLKPLITNTYHDSINYLYFVTSVACRVAIKIYQRPNTLLRTVYVDGAAANAAYRVGVSPDDLIAQFGADVFSTGGSEFDDEFTAQFGSPANLSNGIYYTVTLQDESGNQLSETRTFAYVEKPCDDVLDIIWGNDLGGFDSLTFTKFKQSTTLQRTTIAANTLQLSDTGDLLAVINNVFNPDSVIIASAKQTTFSIVSGILNDDFSYYAKGLVESKKVLVRLSNGDLYPINIIETNYDANNRRINTSNNRLSLTFNITDTNIKL